jgi:hypothetical protein
MAEAPSLSEITNIKPEATVNPGVVLEGGAQMVQQINQSAQFNAEMKQRKYAESLGMLKDIYQDIGAVQAMPIMEEDKPVINQKLAAIFDEIGKDPRTALAGAKYTDIEKRLGEVRSLATQSKQDNIAYDFHRKLLEQDPDLQTPENIAIVDNFGKSAPLGHRKFPIIEMPPAFDLDKAAAGIMGIKDVGKKYSDSQISADNKWIETNSGIEYDRNAFLSHWNSSYNANPKIAKWAEGLFKKIKDDPSQIGAYADPDTGELPKNAKELYEFAGKHQFNAGNAENIRSEAPVKKVANPYEIMNKKQSLAITMEGIRTNDKIKVAAARKQLEGAPVPQNAAFLVKTYASFIQPTSANPEVLNLPEGQGKVTEQPINNLTNNILKQIVESQKTTIKSGSALGASEAVTSGKDPDLTTRTDKGGIRITYFKKYGEDDKFNMPAGAKVGDPVIDKNTGMKVVESTQVIPPRTVMTIIAPTLISKPIIGQTVEAAANFATGKSAKDFDNTINPENIEKPDLNSQKTVPSGAKGVYTIKGKQYAREDLKAKGYSDAQIDAAIKAGKIK